MTDTRASVSTSSSVVQQIVDGNESAIAELYSSLRPIRRYLSRRLGTDRTEDAYNKVIVDVVVAVQNGRLCEPERFFAHAMNIAKQKATQPTSDAVRDPQTVDVERTVLKCATSESPEELARRAEREAIAERVLKSMTPLQREIMVRYYGDGESEADICEAMGIGYFQFFLAKSQAKARYTELIRQAGSRVALGRKPPQSTERALDAQAIA